MSKAIRIEHESRYWETASFLTLTYDDEHLRYSIKGISTLTRGQGGDMTLFLKRLRKYLDKIKVKYFQCAEYGENTFRPHHHVILYGFDFSHNRTVINERPTLYNSVDLDALWSLGTCYIGTVTWQSAQYVASYCVKKLIGDDALTTYGEAEIEPPYMTSSLGLGKQWITDWMDDIYPRDRIIVKGKPIKPPRYYDQQLQKKRPDVYKIVQEQRLKKEFDDEYYLNAISANIKKDKMLDFMANPKI